MMLIALPYRLPNEGIITPETWQNEPCPFFHQAVTIFYYPW